MPLPHLRCFGHPLRSCLAAALAGLLCGTANAQTNLYWGDLHIHTNYSLDAYGVRNTRITPDMAYRFARGIPIHHDVLDSKVQIDRPLDLRRSAWAEENTRESIFNAMKRKEVYATTGPRIALRVFGGFSFTERDARANDIAEVGYRKGIPMGGDLTNAPRGKAPSLLIHAAKDPVGANLDRSRLRSRAECFLLRACDRNSDAAAFAV